MHYRTGFWAAILTVIVTATFAVAGISTPARSGPFCGPTTWACIPVPYTDVAQFIPGDYLWLIPGLLLVPVFVVLAAAIHAYAPESRRIFSSIGLAFATAFAVVIGADYFVQLTVVIPSLQAGETDGLSLLTQYNPHGLFIAGEALGYLAMSLALLFAAPVFAGGRVERAIRWLFVGGFVLAVAALVWFWIVGGDLIAFEVSVLSINWIVLIAAGVLLSLVFRRALGGAAAGPIRQPEVRAK
ncbi:MAG: hypothetical protein EPO36_06000 [Chloroflexota bacterium]|nr:MAG: hypothetical protein EPO36_06000 [Chloroflexota bacterium]